MDNPFEEMRSAVSRAKEVFRAVEQCSRDMARLLRGNLRQCNDWDLKALKRELKDFNIHTGRWKEK
jgi:hypothetical protein